MKKLLSVNETAAFLELSGKTIRHFADTGFLPCSRGKNKYRMFRMKDLISFRADRREYRKKGEDFGKSLFFLKQKRARNS